MNRYLNSANIVDLGIIGYMNGVVASFRQSMSKQDWTPESKRTVSMAATWLNKAYLQICQQLDDTQKRALTNRLQSWRKAKFDIIRPTITDIKEVTMIELPKEHWFDIVEHCMTGACRNCHLIGKEAEECSIKEIFIKHDVPIDNVKTPPGRCPYHYIDSQSDEVGTVGKALLKAMG